MAFNRQIIQLNALSITICHVVGNHLTHKLIYMQLHRIIYSIKDRGIVVSYWVKLHVKYKRGGNYEDN